jgi:hypothetical protein
MVGESSGPGTKEHRGDFSVTKLVAKLNPSAVNLVSMHESSCIS